MAALLVAACGGGPAASPAPDAATSPARPAWNGELHAGGEAVEAILGPREVHRYRLDAEAGRFVRIVVDQEGVDLSVALADPEASLLVGEVDRLIYDHGPELLLAVTRSAGPHAIVLRGLDGSERGRYRLRVDDLREAGPSDRRAAAAFLRFVEVAHLTGEAAIERWTELAAAWRERDEPDLEADALSQLAWSAESRLDRRRAADLFRAAVATLERTGDRRTEARIRVDLASCLVNLGEAQAAVDQLEPALAIARAEGDRRTEARALHNLGRAYRDQGELQRPLDDYEAALALWRPDDPSSRSRRANTLHELGVLHGRFLGDPTGGRALLEEALATWPASERRYRTFTLNQLGQLAYDDEDLDLARRRFDDALANLGDRDACLGAVTLARLALVDADQGATAVAEHRIDEATSAAVQESCRAAEPTIDLLAAHLAERLRDWSAARLRFERCRELFAEQGDRSGEAVSLAGVARAERELGEPAAALAASRQALAILTGVRPTLLREDLRTSFFASVQDPFDFHIDLLLDQGAVAEAWSTAESARAQALRDSLIEAGVGLRRDAADDQIARERSLQRRLNALDTRRHEARERDPESVDGIRKQIAEVIAELEAVRGEIRRRGAAADTELLSSLPIAPADLQNQLDDDILLLEYRLGAKASYLWAVDSRKIAAFRLPERRRLEELAREASAWLRSLQWPRQNPGKVCEASRVLLGPVAAILGRRRLVIVADGVLESLAFAGLPEPSELAECADAGPLMASHEIVYLPSAAVLATQRRALAGRRPVAGWVAVLSDPIYEPTDERLPNDARSAAASSLGAFPGGSLLRRLAQTGAEATSILSALPSARTLRATGAEASRELVLGGRLAGYRVLHFATHGLLSAEQPQLSLLALSRFDASGRLVEGDLYAHEVHGLDLPAELVVLSACDTARGREVRGEGLVSGLPRAFLHAGAARVMVSLWAVGDSSTKELMTHFYAGIFERGLSPAAALREAQITMWNQGRPPYQWAPFILLGDPRPLPPFTP